MFSPSLNKVFILLSLPNVSPSLNKVFTYLLNIFQYFVTLSLFTKLRQSRDDLCCLLIAFANSLDSNQERQNVGPDLDPMRLFIFAAFQRIVLA